MITTTMGLETYPLDSWVNKSSEWESENNVIKVSSPPEDMYIRCKLVELIYRPDAVWKIHLLNSELRYLLSVKQYVWSGRLESRGDFTENHCLQHLSLCGFIFFKREVKIFMSTLISTVGCFGKLLHPAIKAPILQNNANHILSRSNI